MARIQRLARIAFAILICASLLACGPGGGGTGTGPINGMLTFSGGSQGAVTSPGPGFCVTNCGTADLVLQDERVELVADCRRFTFTGSWDIATNGNATLRGTFETVVGKETTTQTATLQLQFGERQAASTQVSAVVLDDAGRPLLGPLTLQRGAPSNATFSACVPR